MESQFKDFCELAEVFEVSSMNNVCPADDEFNYNNTVTESAKTLFLSAMAFTEYVSKDFLYVARVLLKASAVICSTKEPASFIFIKDFITKLINTNESNVVYINMPYPLGERYTIFMSLPHQFRTMVLFGILKCKKEISIEDAFLDFNNNENIIRTLTKVCVIQSPILHRSFELLYDWLLMNYENIEEQQLLVILDLCMSSWPSPFKTIRKYLIRIITFLLKHESRNKLLVIFARCSNLHQWETPLKMFLGMESVKHIQFYNPIRDRKFDMKDLIEILNRQSYLHWAGEFFKVILSKITYEDFREEIYPTIIQFFMTNEHHENYTNIVEIFCRYFFSSSFVFPQINAEFLDIIGAVPDFAKLCIVYKLYRNEVINIHDAHSVFIEMLESADPFVSVEAFSMICSCEKLANFDTYPWCMYLSSLNFMSHMTNSLRRKVVVGFDSVICYVFQWGSNALEIKEPFHSYVSTILFIVDSIIGAIKAPNVHRNLVGLDLCNTFLVKLEECKSSSSFYVVLMQDPQFSTSIDIILNTLMDTMKSNFGSDDVCKSAAKIFNKHLLENATPEMIHDMNEWCIFQILEHPRHAKSIHLTSCANVIKSFYQHYNICPLQNWNMFKDMINETYEELRMDDGSKETKMYFPGLALFINELLFDCTGTLGSDDDEKKAENNHFFNQLFDVTVDIVKKFISLLYLVQSAISLEEAQNNKLQLLTIFNVDQEFVNFECEFMSIQIAAADSTTEAYKNVKEFVELTLKYYSLLMTTLINVDSVCTVSNISTCINVMHTLIATSQVKALIMHSSSNARNCFKEAWKRSHEFKNVLFTFFNDLLLSIKMSTYGPYTVRRNPESRVLLHAITSALEGDNKQFLSKTLQYLIELLEGNEISNDVKTSALHSLQPLITDNNMQYATFPYIEPVCKICLENFSTAEWKLKNAALQTYGGMVTRIIGHGRGIDIKDLFFLYPKFCNYFFVKLKDHQFGQESAIAVLMLVSQSYYKSDLYKSRNDVIIYQSFQKVLVSILKNSTGHLRIYASKAYLTFCDKNDIPHIIIDLVKYMMNPCHNLGINVIVSCLYILKNLYRKLKKTSKYSKFKDYIDCYLYNLLLYLNTCTHKDVIFACSYVKTGAVKDLIDRVHYIDDYADSDVCANVSFTNYLNSIVYFCDNRTLISILDKYLHARNSITAQSIFFTFIINRHKETISQENRCLFANIILKFFIRVENIFLFSKIVATHLFFLLVECSNDVNLTFSSDTVNEFLSNCKLIDIYECSIFCCLSLNFGSKLPNSMHFERILNHYKNAIFSDDANVRHFGASTLIYFFYVSERVLDIFELVFALFMSSDNDAGFEVCKFVSKIYSTKLFDRYKSCKNFLNIENLLQYLDVYSSVKFLFSCLQKLCSFSNKFALENEEFDVGFDDIIYNKDIVENLLVESLEIALQLLTKGRCLQLLLDS